MSSTSLKKKTTATKSTASARKSLVPTAMLASAMRVAPNLLKNGKPVDSAKLRPCLSSFDWFPGGSAKEVKQARLDAIKHLYAVSILAKAWPKEFSRLRKELQIEYKCRSRKNILIRAIIPASSRSRANAFFSEKKRILDFLYKNGVKPEHVSKYVWDENLSLTDMLHSARATRARSIKKRKKANSKTRVARLTDVVGKLRLAKNDRFLAEARYSNGHAEYIRTLRLPVLTKAKARNQRWKRIADAAMTCVKERKPVPSGGEQDGAGRPT